MALRRNRAGAPASGRKKEMLLPWEIGNSALTTSEVTCKIFIAAAYYNGRLFILCKELFYMMKMTKRMRVWRVRAK